MQREAKRMANLGSVVERVEAVREEVASQLPPATPDETGKTTSSTFADRAESIAEELGEADVRDIFARLLAGEAARPGRFSVRTLEIVRALDGETAATFEFRQHLLLDAVVGTTGVLDDGLVARGLHFGVRTALHEAGLVQKDTVLTIHPGGPLAPTTGAIWSVGRDKIRVFCAAPEKARAFSLSIERLTRPGLQLHSVLPAPKELGFPFVEEVASVLIKSSRETVRVEVLSPPAPDGRRFWLPFTPSRGALPRALRTTGAARLAPPPRRG